MRSLLLLASATLTFHCLAQAPGAQRRISGIEFVWAPAGTFVMGAPTTEPERRPDEGPVQVTLSKGFWIGKYEVTQAQWKSHMGDFRRPQNRGTGDNVPVYWVSFTDAEEFCRRATAAAHADGTLPADWEIRLPTEAQWEYAARAGTTTATSFGNRLTLTDANIGSAYPGPGKGNPDGESKPVGSYKPNAWGLYDMHGNVWEYCRDWYHRNLPGGTDPDLYDIKGEPNRDGTYSRVRRGGAWVEQGWACRSAVRLRYEPERGSDHIGFRVTACPKGGTA
ncbi:hypothetical protein F183_A02600 [Bryobacterales bacterium F-183]|nr:hypothetical protein F183_A02600 [Bryobacterales bacterium F-183]